MTHRVHSVREANTVQYNTISIYLYAFRYTLRTWFLSYLLLIPLFNVYGYSSFHIYPAIHLFLLITRGHGYFFY